MFSLSISISAFKSGTFVSRFPFPIFSEAVIKLFIDIKKRELIKSNHSSTHLLHHYLRKTLGLHVQQRGSSVTDKGFRFDFTHNKSLSEKELNDIEVSVNKEISLSSETQSKVLPFDKAIESGALAFFDEKYDDNVRVISIGKDSVELCGGTHVKSTSEIGVFKIINQSSVANGVRRVECVTGPTVLSLSLIHI